MESKVDQFTRGFFWCGYGVFLLASIPHIAAYFRHFDPNATAAEDVFWWIIAYALAVVIDLSDVLISIAVMRAMARGEGFKQLWSFWSFIVFIMALSWFFNWQYNVVNETTSFAAVDSTLILNWITVGTINPIIGSAFQVLLLVYTAMAHKFAQKPVEKTAIELEAQANEMAEKDIQFARIEALKKTQKQRRREAFFAEVKHAKDGALQVVKGEAKPVAKEVKDAANERRNEDHSQPDIEENSDANDLDTQEEMMEDGTAYQASKRDDLGMIEGMMYDKVVEKKPVLVELLNMAQMMPISDLTLRLQSRFSAYAHYINETRVRNVFEAIQAEYPELISQANENDMQQDMGPSTDPEQETISAANTTQNAGDIPSVDRRENDAKSDENASDIPSNITPISRQKKARITGKLTQDVQANAPANESTMSNKKGAYAITKQAAAEAIGCPISEIERGITEGTIKPFAKDNDKVLRSSLEGFVPQRRARKTVKMSTVKR